MLNLIPNFSPVLNTLWQADSPQPATVFTRNAEPTTWFDAEKNTGATSVGEIFVRLPFNTGTFDTTSPEHNKLGTTMTLLEFVNTTPAQMTEKLKNVKVGQWNQRTNKYEYVDWPQSEKNKFLEIHTKLCGLVPGDLKKDGNVSADWKLHFPKTAVLDLSTDKIAQFTSLPAQEKDEDAETYIQTKLDDLFTENRSVFGDFALVDENGKIKTENGQVVMEKQWKSIVTPREAYVLSREGLEEAKADDNSFLKELFQNLIKTLESLFGQQTCKSWMNDGVPVSDEARDAFGSSDVALNLSKEILDDINGNPEKMQEVVNAEKEIKRTAEYQQKLDVDHMKKSASDLHFPCVIEVPKIEDDTGYPPAGGIIAIDAATELNKKDAFGRTALHLITQAAQKGGTTVHISYRDKGVMVEDDISADKAVSMLIGAGADVHAKDAEGNRPSDYYSPYSPSKYPQSKKIYQRLKAKEQYEQRVKRATPGTTEYIAAHSTSVQYGNPLRPRWVSIPNDQLEKNAYRSGNKYYLKDDSPWHNSIEHEPVYMSPERQEYLRESAITQGIARGDIKNDDVPGVRDRIKISSALNENFSESINNYASEQYLKRKLQEAGITEYNCFTFRQEDIPQINMVLNVFSKATKDLQDKASLDYKNQQACLVFNVAKITTGEVDPPSPPNGAKLSKETGFAYMPSQKQQSQG